MMKNYLGEVIYNCRIKEDMTQDEFGRKYDVSGPAIFKFEKGYVTPSLDLWLKMAADIGISERRAVLLWWKRKLPEAYEQYIELQSPIVAEKEAQYLKKKGRKSDYGKLRARDAILEAAEKDRTLPDGVPELINDPELWALYKPTGKEINLLRDTFGPLGNGSKQQYRDALLVLREFKGATA